MNGGEKNEWDEYLPEQDQVNAGVDQVQAGVEQAGAVFTHDDAPGLALGEEERLPWLESADDVIDEPAGDNMRLFGFGLLAVLALAAIVGAIYWFSHSGNAGSAAADGSLIEASKEPYKVAPKDPGGKTFEGTGDSSFKVSEGEHPAANLAGSGVAPKPAATVSASPSTAASTGAAAPAAGGVAVQVGAFSSNATAEAAWSKLSSAHEALKGLSHRVVEGKADIGTVYRLQALASDGAAADALCGKLQAGGLKCQVKR